MMRNIEIKKSNIFSPGICIVKVDDWYKTAYITEINVDNVIIELSGTIKVFKKEEIYRLYFNDGDTSYPMDISKNQIDRILKLKEKPKNDIDKALMAYTNMAEIRRLSHIEVSEGVARLIIPLTIDKKQVGYIMQRAVNASQGDHEKATEMLLRDLKQFNLSIINI